MKVNKQQGGSVLIVLIAVVIAILEACQPRPAPPPTPIPATLTPLPPAVGTPVATVPVTHGFGASKGWWEVYFTDPPGAGTPHPESGGIDVRISELLAQTARTLDVVAFELNNQAITMGILDAHRRGVRVRVVADNEHTIEDEGTTMNLLVDAGIPIVYDKRTAFMHNKFMILDSTYVITGSTNWTVNDVYRNNNNLLVMRTRRAVDAYQNVFNKMFDEGQFGPRRVGPNAAAFAVDGIPVEIHFSPEDGVVNAIQEQLALAQNTIRFMAFSFTEDRLGLTLLDRAQSGVRVEGIFETRGSETQFSELRLLYCAGLDVRQDGNPRTMHHKVFIVDDTHVITGSFNFSANAIQSNDENLVIIHDPELARQYIAEYERVKSVSSIPSSIVCN